MTERLQRAYQDWTHESIRAALVKFGFDTGDYMCRCADCGLQFQGAKRSWRCRPCADEAVRGRAHSPFPNSANAPRAALVEKVAQAMAVCEGYDANNHFIVGSFKDSAEAAIDLIRAEVLEEAAKVADQAEATDRQAAREPNDAEELAAFMRGAFKSRNIAAAIRAMKEKTYDR